MPWTLTVRTGPRVERSRFAQLDDALDALEQRARQLSQDAPRDVVDTKIRRFEAVERVSARLEVAGPGRLLPATHAGVDVRGDGSTEAYSGRINRELIEQRTGESAYAALRRVLGSAAT